jgi:GT2 family glycosyltransferase
MDLSVVIVNWNAKEFLEECLGSVLGNRSSLAIEVILVDNNSGDGSVEMVKDRFPGVVCIENKFNAGFGAANNQGIRMCKSIIYCF